MTKANAHKLFRSREPAAFNRVITVEANDNEARDLVSARNDIRDAIRPKFKEFRKSLADQRSILLENRGLDAIQFANSLSALDVRFLTQGSYVYDTLVRPAYPHVQEIDLDDGIYIAMPFVNGRPMFSSSGLFSVIQNALEPLVKDRGWSWKRKKTCLRIQMPEIRSHIDLPLFAVESGEFGRITRLYEMNFSLEGLGHATQDSLLKAANNRFDFENGKILLAHRDEDWTPSDPKKIHNWFTGYVKRYGNCLKRTCRYLKAWRDKTWIECDLSSLALMAMTVQAFKDLSDRPVETRDDALLLLVTEKIGEYIRSGNVGIPELGLKFDTGWSTDDRKEFAVKADALAFEIKDALTMSTIEYLVVKHLQVAFGPRLPHRPDLVDIAPSQQISAIMETKAETVAAPVVGTSSSG